MFNLFKGESLLNSKLNELFLFSMIFGVGITCWFNFFNLTFGYTSYSLSTFNFSIFRKSWLFSFSINLIFVLTSSNNSFFVKRFWKLLDFLELFKVFFGFFYFLPLFLIYSTLFFVFNISLCDITLALSFFSPSFYILSSFTTIWPFCSIPSICPQSLYTSNSWFLTSITSSIMF